jgi:putative colanic acid biosynthesis UDP-glucose lipid carrier transferase
MFIQTRYNYLLRYVLLITDMALLNVIYFCSFYLTLYGGKSLSNEINFKNLVICNLSWMVCALSFRLYSVHGTRKLERIYRHTWRTLISHCLCFTLFLFFFKEGYFSRSFTLIFFTLLSIAFLLNRFLVTVIQAVLLRKFGGARKIAVMGSNPTALRISEYLKGHKTLAFYGFVGNDESIYVKDNGSVSELVSNNLATAALNGVLDVYVAVAPERMMEVSALMNEADRQCVRLKFVPDLAAALPLPFKISYLGGEFPIITMRHEPLELMQNRFKKRAIDVVFSLFVIVFILSWLYPLIGLLIKLESKGPVLFKQLRSGRNDMPFICLKFRSMTVNKQSDALQATKNDLRVTKIGRFLRKTSLDEMPQFFNVLLGQMSVVGPRPHMLSHTEQYKAIIGKFMVRHFLKPGITGWAQVNGLRGETKDTEAMESRVKHDIYYLENWTGALDLRIVFMTIINAFRGEKNAY